MLLTISCLVGKHLPDMDYIKAYSELTDQLYSTTKPTCFHKEKLTREAKKSQDIIAKKTPSLKIISKVTSSYVIAYLSWPHLYIFDENRTK